MARDDVWHADTPVSVRDVLYRLIDNDDREGADVSSWAFAVGDLVGASPEVLAHTNGGVFTCRVLAGTSAPGQGQTLFTDPKEMSEHRVARDSVTSKLGAVGVTHVQTSPPSLLSLPNVDHLQTIITGHIGEDTDCATIAAAFHPTAAICGTPPAAATVMIKQLEGMGRGGFTGPVGVMSPAGDGQWNIALRCAATITEDGQPDTTSPAVSQWRLLAGAGIMPSSVPAHEWQETGAKMELMRSALGIK